MTKESTPIFITQDGVLKINRASEVIDIVIQTLQPKELRENLNLRLVDKYRSKLVSNNIFKNDDNKKIVINFKKLDVSNLDEKKEDQFVKLIAQTLEDCGSNYNNVTLSLPHSITQKLWDKIVTRLYFKKPTDDDKEKMETVECYNFLPPEPKDQSARSALLLIQKISSLDLSGCSSIEKLNLILSA